MTFIIAQILGGIALILVSVGYFFKNKPHFLIMQIVANAFYAASFICLNSLVAGTITFISIFRCLYIFLCEKCNFKHTPHFLPIFFCLYLTIGIVFWKSWFDIIPMCTSIMFTIAFYIKNVQTMRYILLVPNALLMFYSITCKTYTNAILDLLEVCIVVVSIIYFHIKSKHKKDKSYEIVKNICFDKGDKF